MRHLRHLALILLLTAATHRAAAFALLGPFAPWMTTPLAYQIPNAIGGPMLLGEGYRWNVPIITYAYDQSFLDYFGTNGVAAIESAIQIFNQLPPASTQTNFSAYPLKTDRINFYAQSQYLLDLKSKTMAMLIEQLGLAQPSVAVWSLRSISYDPTNHSPTYLVENRNYDPTTLAASPSVNNNPFGYTITSFPYFAPDDLYAAPYTAGTIGDEFPAVADSESGSLLYDHTRFGTGLDIGAFITGLTRDDAGGLAYLYSSNTLAFEGLLPNVHGTGANATNYVTRALRPGVDKILFKRLTLDPHAAFTPVTNQYTDTYITNGVPQQQTLERVINQPDILFSALYIGGNPVARTGTTNWINNGAPGHDGPGLIQPPVVINFDRLGPSLIFGDDAYPPSYPAQPISPIWAAFDGTTNLPVTFPAAATGPTQFHFLLLRQTATAQTPVYTWPLPGPLNSLVALQTSTNLTDWLTLATLTNSGGTFTYVDNLFTNAPQRYFRTLPQP